MADESTSNQERILIAARRLFLEKGFNGSNLRDIARAAKVSMGGIYHHVSSKEEIYTTLLEASDVGTDLLSVLPLFHSETFPENLPAVGSAIAGMVRKHRDTFKLFYIDVLEFEGRHVKPLISRFRENFGGMAEALLAPRDTVRGDIHPAIVMRVLVDVFVHSRLEEVMLEQTTAEQLGLTEDEVIAQTATLLLTGLLRSKP